jgi:hypothetical protein
VARKRKTLPKDFKHMLQTASLEELKAVFDTCELTATGGYSKGTALSFTEAPDELVTWLVEQGLGVDTPDSYGRTPLATRARHWSRDTITSLHLLVGLGADVEAQDKHGVAPLRAAVEAQRPGAVKALLGHGADVKVTTERGQTLLDIVLIGAQNAYLEQTVEVTETLLAHGLAVTEDMREQVKKIGERFEFYRADFAMDRLEEADAALTRLYEIFDVEPVPRRFIHDGTSAIRVPDGRWQDQHEALWDLLVPGKGTAATIQGEVIRITGVINDEMLRNGGTNWAARHKTWVDELGGRLSPIVWWQFPGDPDRPFRVGAGGVIAGRPK